MITRACERTRFDVTDAVRLADPLPPLEFGRLGVADDRQMVRRGPQVLTAGRVVLAIPPRVVVRDIEFSPALPSELLSALNEIPTWMAGQAKTAIVYKDRFWAKEGLSGTASSFVGPLGELHDSTPLAGKPSLFGFVALPAETRSAIGVNRLHELTIAQLVRLFGPQAATPVTIATVDWALERFTCTEADLLPDCALDKRSQGQLFLWSQNLLFTGSELAPEHAGYLEGALSAAESSVAMLGLL